MVISTRRETVRGNSPASCGGTLRQADMVGTVVPRPRAQPLAGVGFAFVVATLWAGVVLAITFFGLAIIGLAVRGSRGIGGFHRELARSLLNEGIEDPEPFDHRPGFLGWLQASLRDRTGWRSMAYVAAKVPLALLGIFGAFSVWWDAFFCITNPIWGWERTRPRCLRTSPDRLRA